MRYKFYTKTERAWDAMLSAVERARESVFLESYIFLGDTSSTHNFFGALMRKAREGVRVKVIIDATGSPLSAEERARFSDAGVELLVFRRWTRHIHRKVLIVDERVAFLGGVNVGTMYRTWLDLHLRIEGRSIIRALLRSFAHSYREAGGADPAVLAYEARKGNPFLRARVWLHDHRPAGGKGAFRDYYRDKLASAKRHIVIVTPYFFPHRWLRDACAAARRRGVRIEVILPRHTDPAIADIPNRIFVEALHKTGMQFYFLPVMNHAKAILVDDIEGMVGSPNIDAQSLDWNAEVGVSFRDPRMIADLARIVEMWRAEAEPYRHDIAARRWYHWFLECLVFFLQPFI